MLRNREFDLVIKPSRSWVPLHLDELWMVRRAMAEESALATGAHRTNKRRATGNQ